jgi:hypothetical protein
MKNILSVEQFTYLKNVFQTIGPIAKVIIFITFAVGSIITYAMRKYFV